MGKELEILLLTHGDWGKYIIDAGKMIVGNVDRVSQISLNPADTFEEFYEKVENKVSEMKEGSLIITDIFGGTTTNVAAKLSLSYKINIISGLNAPLLFEALLNIDSINEDSVLDSIVEEGRDSCKNILKELRKMTK
ncbi:EIIAB-Man [Sebaldella termitidis]|jgi:D-glucosaminate-specific PTS system IIA component|uniref:PTS system fructose subfamily IIA component n=1 Tax=Sebaldella termitidis (strain ATCC 33386 / NCTC 11300) TaxID=526218 RepID=D1AG72_SEBTE|nr:PTS sugar transporter subunit IIA [Sebaldella termitidis]ACZ10698.1 PTS system fructose subfamily IIA component [Sebaldella termitidis ATCC 33386]MBP7979584.1 PTS sugar transporter subunit IIA [Sebaldella sp.]SUI26039.1 EIIAB-Man [Sebaldella termitidis]